MLFGTMPRLPHAADFASPTMNVSLIKIGRRVIHAYQFAVALGSPQILAEPAAIVAYQRVGSIQYIAMRAIVLLQLDDFGNVKIALKLLHVTGIRAAKRIDTLIVIANGKYSSLFTGEQL